MLTRTAVISKVTGRGSACKLTHVALGGFEVLVGCLLEKSVSLPLGSLHRITSNMHIASPGLRTLWRRWGGEIIARVFL